MPITACKFDSCPGHNHQAPMAELVDAYVSGAYIERCAGSTPVRGTLKTETLIDNQSVRVFLFVGGFDETRCLDRDNHLPEISQYQVSFIYLLNSCKCLISSGAYCKQILR